MYYNIEASLTPPPKVASGLKVYIVQLYVTKCLTIPLYLTKLYVTKSFAIASYVTYKRNLPDFYNIVNI